MAVEREYFPIFQSYPQLIYLDNAATTQKPQAVLAAERDFYVTANANPYRGVYELGARATAGYQHAREVVAQFLHVADPNQLVFTRGATEAVNLVAYSYGLQHVTAGDCIVVSAMEHHSNLLPWQRLAKQMGANLRVVQLTAEGELDLVDFKRALELNPKLVAITHVSNVLGTINPVELLVQLAHQQGAAILIDGAQAVGHMTVDLQQLDPDFYLFSGHKVYAPQGIGVLYIRSDRLAEMQPYQLGGGMVAQVSFEDSSFADPPHCFEAGTPNVAGAVGLGAALEWLNTQDLVAGQQREKRLTALLVDGLRGIPGVNILGCARDRTGVVSWTMDGIHPHDIATFLSEQQIAVRAGHHCAMPLMNYYHQSATVRASLAIYNQESDIEQLIVAMDKLRVWWYK